MLLQIIYTPCQLPASGQNVLAETDAEGGGYAELFERVEKLSPLRLRRRLKIAAGIVVLYKINMIQAVFHQLG